MRYLILLSLVSIALCYDLAHLYGTYTTLASDVSTCVSGGTACCPSGTLVCSTRDATSIYLQGQYANGTNPRCGTTPGYWNWAITITSQNAPITVGTSTDLGSYGLITVSFSAAPNGHPSTLGISIQSYAISATYVSGARGRMLSAMAIMLTVFLYAALL